MKKVDHFKYLSTIVSADGSCEEKVRRRVQARWQSWRRASGVLCDRKLSARLNGKMYKSVVQPPMLYGMETVVVNAKLEKKMEAAELKIVRWALGVTLKDRVRNKYIWGTAKIRRVGEKMRGEKIDGIHDTRKEDKREATEEMD